MTIKTSRDDLDRAIDDFLAELVSRNPVMATHIGDHRFNHKLKDMRPEALESQEKYIAESLARFQAMDVGELDAESRVDHRLMVQIIASFVRSDELEKKERRHPGSYLNQILAGVGGLLLKEYAPLPERLEAALGRVRETPRLLAEARSNLVPKDVPAPWAETTIQQARQAVGLFEMMLPGLAREHASHLAKDLEESGGRASEALQGFVSYIEEKILPVAEGDFAAGKELFDAKLREEHMVDYDSDELLETGRRLFEETRSQMEAVAREIDPERTVAEILEEAKSDHPTPESLLPEYRDAMAEIRRYVIDKEIVSLPENESLRIIETPAYMRPLIPYAAYMSPGMLEERQDGIFVVTPVDPESPAEEQTQKLKGHYRAKLPITALHEAYPGHHLQLVWANRCAAVPRRIGAVLSTLFVEGWAFYCEELLETLGYIDKPVQRLARLSDQLWRAARIVIDVSLHTRGMSIDEAVNFLVEECRLEPSNASVEVRRYVQTPTQPQTYLMGKLAIVDLVADYRRAHPEAGMREVHDAIVKCGSLPPRLMRMALGLEEV